MKNYLKTNMLLVAIMTIMCLSNSLFGMNEENGILFKSINNEKIRNDLKQLQLDKINRRVMRILTEDFANGNKLLLDNNDVSNKICIDKEKQPDITTINKPVALKISTHLNLSKSNIDEILKKYDGKQFVMANPGSAESFLKYAGETFFKNIDENDTELGQIFVDAVTQENLIEVSANLFIMLLDLKDGLFLAQKIVPYIHADNITKIHPYLLNYVVNVKSAPSTIAKNAFTPENINMLAQKTYGSSILEYIVGKDESNECTKIIFNSAITEDNFKESAKVINYLTSIDRTLQEAVNKLKCKIDQRNKNAAAIIKRQSEKFVDLYFTITWKEFSGKKAPRPLGFKNRMKEEYEETFKKYYDKSHSLITLDNAHEVLGIINYYPCYKDFFPFSSTTLTEKSYVEKQATRWYLISQEEAKKKYENVVMNYHANRYKRLEENYNDIQSEQKMISIIVAYDLLTATPQIQSKL